MRYSEFDQFTIYSSYTDDYKDVTTTINFNTYNTYLDQQVIYTTNLVNKTFLPSKVLTHEDDIQSPQIFSTFLFLRQSTITSFFSTNLIDMPICFKKSKSLYSKTFELPLLKFTNLIMRGGAREQVIKNISLSFSKCFNRILKNFNITNYTR